MPWLLDLLTGPNQNRNRKSACPKIERAQNFNHTITTASNIGALRFAACIFLSGPDTPRVSDDASKQSDAKVNKPSKWRGRTDAPSSWRYIVTTVPVIALEKVNAVDLSEPNGPDVTNREHELETVLTVVAYIFAIRTVETSDLNCIFVIRAAEAIEAIDADSKIKPVHRELLDDIDRSVEHKLRESHSALCGELR